MDIDKTEVEIRKRLAAADLEAKAGWGSFRFLLSAHPLTGFYCGVIIGMFIGRFIVTLVF